MKSLARLSRVAVLFVPIAVGCTQGNDALANDDRWSGLYVGVHTGAAWGDSPLTFSNGNTASLDIDGGGLIGGHTGYLFDWGGFVAGVDISYSGLPNVDGGAPCPNAAAVCEIAIENLLLLNGRLGFEFGRAMLYATGGWARSTVDVSRSPLGLNANNDRHVSGWNLGGGYEYIIWDHLLIGVEYIHVDYDEPTFALTNAGPLFDNVRVDPDLDIVRARLTVQLHRERERPYQLK